MNQQKYFRILLGIILLTGIILRFYNYYGWSLSNDELSAMARLRFPDFRTMIREGVMLNDMHPPGVQGFLWFWTHVFGTAQALYRLPFVLAGCFSILLFYRIGFKWFGEQAALLSTAVFAGLSFLVLYSQLARPYSFGLLFCLLFADAWTNLLIRNERTVIKPGNLHYLYFILAGAACMYTHYFCFMVAGLIGISGFLFLTTLKEGIRYVLAGLLMFVLFLPGLPVAIHQFSIGGLGGPEGWLGPPKEDAIRQFLYYAFNESIVLIFLLLVVFIGGFITTLSKQEWKLRFLAFAWSMLPVFIAYYYSLHVNPVYQYSILIFGFPFLLLFLLAGFRLKKPMLAGSASMLILLLCVYSMTKGQHFYSKAQFAIFREIAEKTVEYSKEYGNENVDRTINVITPFYIHYYLDPIAPGMKYELYSSNTSGDLRNLDSLVKHGNENYFLHAWTNTWHSMETEQIIQAGFPYLVKRDSFFNAGLLLYSKQGTPDQLVKHYLDTVNSFETVTWDNDAKLMSDSIAHDGKYAMRMRSTDEYSSGIKVNAGSIHLKKGITLQADIFIFPVLPLAKETQLVITVENDKGKIAWLSRQLSDFAINTGSWQQVFLSYTFTEDIQPDDKVLVYIWNNGKSDFFADNFRIQTR